MALYDITNMKPAGSIADLKMTKVERTTFVEQGIHERTHLQAALRDHIEVIEPDLFVVAEEFGDFEGVQRRIDLLCLDRDGRIVVVELKRTADGGHMELQALRYAAMVSTMTFDQVAKAHAKYRKARGAVAHTEEDARSALLSWLESEDESEAVISREVGIVLASEDFSQEVTTTVLWLNEFHNFDIRCVRLRPYEWEDRLLLDVQPVIPLPEASLYTVRVREKEKAGQKAAGKLSADWTKFVVKSPGGLSEPLPKRWAMLRLVEAMVSVGVPMEQIQSILPASKLLKVDGQFPDPAQLWSAVQLQFGKSDDNRKRWHLDDPIVTTTHTWVLNNNWGLQSRKLFGELVEAAPSGFAVYEEDEVPEQLA